VPSKFIIVNVDEHQKPWVCQLSAWRSATMLYGVSEQAQLKLSAALMSGSLHLRIKRRGGQGMPAEYFQVDMDVRPLLGQKADCQEPKNKSQVNYWLAFFMTPISWFSWFVYSILGVPLLFLFGPCMRFYDNYWTDEKPKRHSAAYDES